LEKIEELPVENKIYNEDCITFLKRLPDRSVDLFILDPPYYKVVVEKWDNEWKSYSDYHNWCMEWFKQIERTSKYSTSIYLFGFPYQLSRLLADIVNLGFEFRQQIIIDKGLQSVAGRTSDKLKMFPTATESIFFFCYDSTEYLKNLLNKEKEKIQWTSKQINEYLGKASNGGGTWSSIAGIKQMTLSQPTRVDWDKLNELFSKNLPNYDDVVFKFNGSAGLTDVWTDINFYDRKIKKIHPTQKPESLIDRLICASSNENDLVVDLFMGSGTTAIECIKNNRKYAGCELDKNYYEKSLKRIEETDPLLKFLKLP
tara:strand:+ start:110 stop:1051 length:942 start_codon:yes stop_codon:yes gene_type:complete